MIIWKGDQFYAEMKSKLSDRLTRAAINLCNSMKKNLSTKAQKDENGRYVKGESIGDYPRLRTGELRRSLTWEVDKDELEARVGTNKIYAKHLELGTRYMSLREFLERTLQQEKDTTANLLAGKKIDG